VLDDGRAALSGGQKSGRGRCRLRRGRGRPGAVNPARPKPRRGETPAREPSLPYTQPWYSQRKKLALPYPAGRRSGRGSAAVNQDVNFVVLVR
jgi:hypothetical protein